MLFHPDKTAMQIRYYLLIFYVIIFLQSCKTGSVNLFKPASPHELYQRKLAAAGLDKTSLGTAWMNAASPNTQKTQDINLPFKETGYFPQDKTPANFYKFRVTMGKKITISLKQQPDAIARIYLDLWELTQQGTKALASADTLGHSIAIEVSQQADYLLRVQPELLQSAGYTLEITEGPSLGFPTKAGRNNIRSFWGDGRDENTRKHEGVDIFGSLRSPVVATGKGRVTRVNENNLGGKVVWFRLEDKDYTLYYAHLDEQLAVEGQQVSKGDTLGLMGNTGNAKTTAPHLHFGIYTSAGAVDPLPFIDPLIRAAPEIQASLDKLNKTMRTAAKVTLKETSERPSLTLSKGTILTVNAAHANLYTIELPDGKVATLNSNQITEATVPISSIKLAQNQTLLYDAPKSSAAIKAMLIKGDQVKVLGNFESYQLIRDEASRIGWILR